MGGWGCVPLDAGMTAMGMAGQMRPPFSFWSCPKRECAAPGVREKGAGRAPVQWPSARDGGRRIGACSDFAWPSGTLWPSARSILPSRGGWCGGRRGARTHLSCFSFRAFRFATRCPGGRGGVRPYGDAKGHLSARRGRCPHRPAAAGLTLCTRFMGRFRRTRADMKSTFPGRRNRYPAAFFR